MTSYTRARHIAIPEKSVFRLLSRIIGKWPNPLHDHVHRGGVRLAMFFSYSPKPSIPACVAT